jgi:hypothetical protein
LGWFAARLSSSGSGLGRARGELGLIVGLLAGIALGRPFLNLGLKIFCSIEYKAG